MKKYLVTSGCSFTDNIDLRWAHYLGQSLGLELYNRGQGSAGNDWISKTAIHQIHTMLRNGVKAEEILCVVMWSGIDRKATFISEKETSNFSSLINKNQFHFNPVSIIGGTPNTPGPLATKEGYLLGSAQCGFGNPNIRQFKQDLILNFCNDESLAIESYEHFLRLQWFCNNYNIDLVNLTFMNIMHYPHYREKQKTWEKYINIVHLHEMIDFSKWIFYGDYDGLYEYTKYNNLPFYSDMTHPALSSHKHYVDCFLLDRIKRLYNVF